MSVLQINPDTFRTMIQSDRPVLVDFWAPWCSYCRRIAPALDKIAEEFENELTAVKINIDEEEALADSLGIEVIPTLVLYRKGAVLGSVTAPESKAAIETFIRNTLNK